MLNLGGLSVTSYPPEPQCHVGHSEDKQYKHYVLFRYPPSQFFFTCAQHDPYVAKAEDQERGRKE